MDVTQATLLSDYMTKCQAVRTGSVESHFIDGYHHYIGNSNNCRRLAGTAGESARTIHVPSSVTCAYRPHMHTRCTCDARLRHARTSTTRLRPGATNAPRHAPPTASRRLLRQLRLTRILPHLCLLTRQRRQRLPLTCLSLTQLLATSQWQRLQHTASVTT